MNLQFLVRDIFERNLLEGARLAAGEKGGNNAVLWVNFMEILDALDSLQNGELLVTTGYQLDDEAHYRDFVLRLKSRGVCGAAIQTGYYIHEIPAYILRDADRYDFPVIELPSKLTFSHIMHVLLEQISQKGDEESDGDLAALKSGAGKLVAACPPERADGPAEGKKYLFVLSAAVSSNVAVHSAPMSEAERLKSYFAGKSTWVGMERSGEKILYFISLKKEFTPNDLIVDLIDLITQISRDGRVNVWIGFSAFSPGDTDGAFEQALSAHRTLKSLGTKKGVCFYGDQRMFEWLEYFRKKNNSLSFAYDALKPIIAYDYFHKSEYLRTLRAFLTNECKLSETSEKLFIHRHTLKNRINKISRLCSADFGSYFTRLHFSIALLIYDYFLS